MSDMMGITDMPARLRDAASPGFDEWRVQDPTDGSYCVAYSRQDTMDPERDARAWLADHKQRFPRGRYVDYVVACVRVVLKKDLLLADAADEIERLTAEADALRRERDEARRDRDMLRLCMNAAACRALVSERDELRRWKGTHAPRLDALEGLLHAAQAKAVAGREAIATLASERAANSILTSEVELLAARLAEIERAEPRFAPCGRSADTSEPTDAEWPEGFEQAVQRLPTLADAVALFDEPAQAKPCRCRRCLTERGDLLTLASTVIVCPTCGNKRCPHATDHRHACTGSDEPGQTGSWYGGMPERAEPAGGCGACGDSCRLADESPRT